MCLYDTSHPPKSMFNIFFGKITPPSILRRVIFIWKQPR
nr:MAG TPA: hypothetical protein [Caudoviricetes sp.]